MDCTDVFVEALQQATPFVFLKYGDGEYAVANNHGGCNCDQTPYTTELGAGVKDSFLYFCKRSEAYLGKWHPHSPVNAICAYWDALALGAGKTVQWADYHSFIVFDKADFTERKLRLFRAIRDAPHRKIYVTHPKNAQEAQRRFGVDVCIPVHPTNWFTESFDTVLDAVAREVSCSARDPCMVLTSCGMGAKPLAMHLHQRFPTLTLIDIGSAWDYLCSGQDSRGHARFYSHEELDAFFSGI